MTDRALLQAAARAAGIKIDMSPYNGGGHGNTGFDMLGNAVLDWHNGTKWNPLTRDDDALRLAVALYMGVQCNGPDHWQAPNCTIVLYGEHYRLTQPHAGDPRASTCRAIVRAAAAIGGVS